MTQTLHRIHLKRFGNPLYSDYALTDIPDLNNQTHGDSATIRLHIPGPGTDKTISSGDTFTVTGDQIVRYNNLTIDGTLEINNGGVVIVNGTLDNNGTITNNGTLKTANTNAGDLKDHDRHGGSFSTVDVLSNTIKYRENIPDTATNIQALVIGIEPSSDLSNEELSGIWGLIDSVSDTRTRALSNDSVAVDVTILGEYSEFTDVADVENNLKITV